MVCLTEKQKFKMAPTPHFESSHLRYFLEDLRAGKLRPQLKSLPVPEKREEEEGEDEEGPVVELVADSYDDEVHRVRKDAVVFFHAPWCSHCKEFDPTFKKVKWFCGTWLLCTFSSVILFFLVRSIFPTYRQVAEEMSGVNKNLVFGKMDGTANDVPHIFPPVQGFPSIFFVRARDKFRPVKYKGNRSHE